MGVNISRVVSAAVATTLLGLLWYGPLLFGRSRMRLFDGPRDQTQTNEMRKRSSKLYALLFLANVLTAFVLGLVIRISTVNTALFGMKVVT